MNGPASYGLRAAFWNVAMFYAGDLGKLVAHKKCMDQYDAKHGARIWALMCQTGVRCCSVLFARLKLDGLGDYNISVQGMVD